MEAQNKTFNNGTLLKGVLIPKLLNKLFASCSFKNLDLHKYSIIIKLIVNLFFVFIILIS